MTHKPFTAEGAENAEQFDWFLSGLRVLVCSL